MKQYYFVAYKFSYKGDPITKDFEILGIEADPNRRGVKTMDILKNMLIDKYGIKIEIMYVSKVAEDTTFGISTSEPFTLYTDNLLSWIDKLTEKRPTHDNRKTLQNK